MKVVFKKAHDGFKSGDVEEVNSDRGRAYINAGIAEKLSPEKAMKDTIKELSEKSEVNPVKRKKRRIGPGK